MSQPEPKSEQLVIPHIDKDLLPVYFNKLKTVSVSQPCPVEEGLHNELINGIYYFTPSSKPLFKI